MISGRNIVKQDDVVGFNFLENSCAEIFNTAIAEISGPTTEGHAKHSQSLQNGWQFGADDPDRRSKGQRVHAHFPQNILCPPYLLIKIMMVTQH